MTEYKKFLTTIEQKDKAYYLNLVKHTKNIILDIGMRNQHQVAKDLHLTPVKLSHLLPLLKALI